MFRRLFLSPPAPHCPLRHRLSVCQLSASSSSPAPPSSSANVGVPAGSRSVFVHNLSFDVKSDALIKHLSKGGNAIVRADIHMNKRKKSKGTAVVTFETVEGARDTISSLNNSKLYGRAMLLREDRAELMDGGSDLLKNRVTGGHDQDNSAVVSVFVGNLNTNVTSAMLKAHMESCGPVVKATVLRGSFRESHGCGVVVYKRASDATRALDELYNSVLNGRLIFVREDREAITTGAASDSDAVTRRIYSSTVPEKGTCVILGNVDRSTKQLAQSVRNFMEQVGAVKKVHLDAQLVGKGRGKILVEYATRAAAQEAIIKLHGTEIGSKKVTIQKYGK